MTVWSALRESAIAVRLLLVLAALFMSGAVPEAIADASGPTTALKRLSQNFRAVDLATFEQAVEDVLTIEHIKGGSFELKGSILRVRTQRCEVSINAELEDPEKAHCRLRPAEDDYDLTSVRLPSVVVRDKLPSLHGSWCAVTFTYSSRGDMRSAKLPFKARRGCDQGVEDIRILVKSAQPDADEVGDTDDIIGRIDASVRDIRFGQPIADGKSRRTHVVQWAKLDKTGTWLRISAQYCSSDNDEVCEPGGSGGWYTRPIAVPLPAIDGNLQDSSTSTTGSAGTVTLRCARQDRCIATWPDVGNAPRIPVSQVKVPCRGDGCKILDRDLKRLIAMASRTEPGAEPAPESGDGQPAELEH